MNDPLLDIATALHWFLCTPEQEAALLTAYFERLPSAHELAKLTLMKQVSWCFFSLVFILIALEDGKLPAMDDQEVPSFLGMMGGLASGSMSLSDPVTRLRMSLAMTAQSLGEMQEPAFAAALALLSTAVTADA